MTDYEILGVSPKATDEEIFLAYKEKSVISKDKKRIELAFKRLKSIKPTIPCPEIKRQDQVYSVK